VIPGRHVDEDRSPSGFYSFDNDVAHENLPVVGMRNHNDIDTG
jgi:hypothetical protein